MPTLNWIGKDKVINHHLDVPFRTLKKEFTFAPDGSDDGNMIIHGDNLEALKALLPQYEGRVRCIYIDPPYNTGNENWVYNDNVNDPRIQKWLGKVVGAEGEDLSRHDKWLCMMYPRLRLLQKLLSDDGAIFISIDDNEQANLKLICDEIFGSHCFVSDLIWRSADSSNNDAKQFSVDYNHTLVYSKNPGWQPLRFARKAENNQHYKNPDNDERGPWFPGNLSSPNPRENLRFDIISPNGHIIHPPKNGWRWSKERVEEMIEKKEIIFSEDETRIIRKTFLKDQAGIVPSNIWWDIEETGHNRNAKYELLKIFCELHSSEVFSTPKPTKFIERLLHLLPSDDLIVLDSFAGSGTTAHAVLNMNKADGGHRKFILVEMGDYADSITAERVRRVINGYGEGKGVVEGTGGSFSFYELGAPVFLQDGSLNPEAPLNDIRSYVYFSETRETLGKQSTDDPYWLGTHENVAYYFCYNPDLTIVLSDSLLGKLHHRAEQYVIYADICAISESDLKRWNIIFKKIPRDITRF